MYTRVTLGHMIKIEVFAADDQRSCIKDSPRRKEAQKGIRGTSYLFQCVTRGI